MLEYDDLQTSNDLEEIFSFLNEAYFGKSKELLEIEKLLDQYRQKYLGKYLLIGSAANTDKILVKINRLFEQQFGFGDFALFIIDTSDMNAFTFSIDGRYDTNVNKNKLVNEKTFKFNRYCDYAVITCIFAGLIFNPKFTTEEILGIILHEIGHNFYAALSTTNTIFSSCDKAVDVASTIHDIYTIFKANEKDLQQVVDAVQNIEGRVITSPLKSNMTVRAIAKAIKKANEKKTDINVAVYDCLSCLYIGWAIARIINTIRQWILILAVPIRWFAAFIEHWMKRTISTIKDPFHMLRLPNGFRNERTADNFATMYGYGPALTSGLMKFEMAESDPDVLKKLPKAVPIISCLFDSLMLPFRLINTAIDPHPLEIQRLTDQIRMLDEEMKKSNLDPKMKKRIQKDVDKMKDCLNTSIDTSRNITTDPNFVKHLTNRIMYNTVEAKSARDILFNFDPNGKYKSYDKVIDDMCNENKK